LPKTYKEAAKEQKYALLEALKPLDISVTDD
jgi:hypothetical protein